MRAGQGFALKDSQRDSAGGLKGSPEALLENIGNSVNDSRSNGLISESEKVKIARRKSWELRSVLWQESNLRAVQSCGRVAITESGEVQPIATGLDVYFSGVATCKSVWSCPVCSARINARRRRELALLFEKALETGSMAFGAYTLRHSRSDSLSDLQSALSDCWRRVSMDPKLKRLRKDLGWIGVVKGVEHTFTEKNGWHPHLHPVHVFDRVLSAEEIEKYFQVEFSIWKRAAEKAGLRAPMEKAQNLHLVEISKSKTVMNLAEYISKGNLMARSPESVAWELTGTTTKTYTRVSESITPFEILEKISLAINAKEKSKWLSIWYEYERVTKGRCALTYSKGLREYFGLRNALRDESELLKSLELFDDTDFGFVLTDYVPIGKNHRLGSGLLNAITPKGNFESGRDFCRKNNLDFVDLLSSGRKLDYGNSRDVKVSRFADLVFVDIPKLISHWTQETF